MVQSRGNSYFLGYFKDITFCFLFIYFEDMKNRVSYEMRLAYALRAMKGT